MKHSGMIAALLLLMLVLTGCATAEAAPLETAAPSEPGTYAGLDVASPEWVGKLEAATAAGT